MVVTTTVDTNQEAPGRLRPLDPARDLGAVADMIATAFQDEMDRQGRAAVRELRWMARLSPVVWWWAQADPSFREMYNGFVWEEPAPGGRGRRVLVGNANLGRTPGNRHRFVICNVVVQPQHRRLGIGRRLMEATIVEARREGAEGVVLQVYEDNVSALRLYTELGFERVGGETELHARSLPPAGASEAPGYHIRPARPADSQAMVDLARQAVPAVQQWLRPVRPAEYQLGWLGQAGLWLSETLTGRRTRHLLAWTESGGDLAALLAFTAALRPGAQCEHRLGLLVHPRHRGQVEAALVSRAVARLALLPVRTATARLYLDHSVAISVLEAAGFRRGRTLLTLSHPFSQEREADYGRL